MTRLLFHIEQQTIPAEPNDAIHVWLYGPSPPVSHAGVVGHQVHDVMSRLAIAPSAAMMDFVAIAMAVTAADTFVARSEAPNGWSRSFNISIPLAEPDAFRPIRTLIEETLRFLSSDEWHFEFLPGGLAPASFGPAGRRKTVFDPSQVECASLFSGGLDSAIGAIDLLEQGRRPLLVSHAAHKDAARQDTVASLLPQQCQRLAVNSYPTWAGYDDDSMRTRSLQFLAIGALAAQCIGTYRNLTTADLYVYENGLIALNPPLTFRRLGSHSTRTAHPYFLGGVLEILSRLAVGVKITDPYKHVTKGEMVHRHRGKGDFESFAAATVSCGKWKRTNEQCGRCVPCLIRRASLHAGNVVDQTIYTYPDLQKVMQSEDGRDDLIAMQSCLASADPIPWRVLRAGPLPADEADRQAYYGVAERGLMEIRSYLKDAGFDT